MRIDLHTHSDRSDGTESPAALVRSAAAAGLDVLALTDHDTTEGWQEASATADEVGIALVRGLEISCAYAGHGVHLLAYLPDPTYPPLAAELEHVLDGRNARLPATLKRLADLGIDIDAAEVRRLAGTRPPWAARTSPTRWSRRAWSPTAARPSTGTSARRGRPT